MKRKILVVDDCKAILFLLKEEIEDQGDEALCCCSGEEALKKEREFKPDIVLSDIRMPGGMNGFEFSQKLKEQKQIPIVLMTAETPLPECAPANAIIEKPFRMEDFNNIANAL